MSVPGSTIQGVVSDISERQQFEAELAFRISLLEAQFETTPDGLLVVDAQGKIILCNQQFQRQWDIPDDLLATKSDEKLLTHALGRLASPDHFLEKVRYLYAHPEEKTADELEFKDGKVLERYSALLVLRTGETVGRIWRFRDITLRKRAEEALLKEHLVLQDTVKELERSRNMLQLIIESIPIRVFWKDRDFRYLGCNSLFARDAGFSDPQQLLGKDDFAMGWREQAQLYRQADRQAMESGCSMINIVEPQTTPAGATVWLSTSRVPLQKSGGGVIGMLGLYEDITERRRTEAELKALHRQLLETSRQAGMSEVATSILHNVGNVLNSVNTSSSLVLEKIRNSRVPNLAKVAALLQAHQENPAGFLADDPKGKQLPGYISALAAHLAGEHEELTAEMTSLQGNIEHIKEIVAMQQNYARQSGVVEPVSLSDLLEDALRINAAGMERHQVQVIREYGQVPPVFTEKHKVLQILVNLLQNAKYALDEAKVSEKRLLLRTEALGTDRVRISISDNGVGIAPENLDRVFQLGFTTRKDGHGFGLHNGALVARELRGALSAHSDGPGQGATFVLELPCQPEEKSL